MASTNQYISMFVEALLFRPGVSATISLVEEGK
jgi:hypothetical protein